MSILNKLSKKKQHEAEDTEFRAKLDSQLDFLAKTHYRYLAVKNLSDHAWDSTEVDIKDMLSDIGWELDSARNEVNRTIFEYRKLTQLR